ncbi:MAG: hypothetical protein IPP72_20690 [Chitinophagaceae bacterium]|nr:hypothetical protein [Chitinophagaceae bacterium]
MKNKKRLIIVLLIVAAAAFAGYKFLYHKYVNDQVAERIDEPLLAFYDRNGNTSPVPIDQCRHISVRLNNTGASNFVEDLKKLLAGKQPVLITVEIWPYMGGKFSKENILSLVAKGDYDEKIKAMAVVLSKQVQPILMRFDPDMEVYVSRYPWQMQWPERYSKAFRHFAETIKKNAPAVKMVWAPAGYPGTEEYWPGDQWVDMVSVTLKGRSEGMANSYPEEKTMSQLIFRKLHRVRFFDKPVLIIGSEKVTREHFKQPDFESAVSYIKQHKEVEYIDVTAADRQTDTALFRKNGALEAGVFDPFDKLVDSVPLSTEHLFVNLEALKGGEFKKKFNSAVARNHNLIVTMEPWRDRQLEKDPLLVDNILNGKYNAVFDELYNVIAITDKKIYLRWLHEMEIPITRYPWQSQDPLRYIKAYRYFVNYIRNKKPANVFCMGSGRRQGFDGILAW